MHSALFIVAILAASGGAFAATIDSITSAGGTKSYAVGQEISFTVSLSGTVTGVTPGAGDANPYLVLSGIQNADSEHQAAYTGTVTQPLNPEDPTAGDWTYLTFSYTVKPGDYSAGVGIQSFELNGATVATDDGNLTSTALPAADFVLNGESITISSSFAFAETGTQAFAATGNPGNTLNVEISRGAVASADQEFTVSVPAAQSTLVSFDSSFKIPGGSASGTFSLSLLAANDDPVTVTLHPQGYTGTAGDLVLTVRIVQAERPYIKAIRSMGDNGAYGVGETIYIEVEFSGPIDIDRFSGSPYLTLNVENAPSTPAGKKGRAFYDPDWGIDGAKMYFKYEVQPGDFSKRLDCVKQGFTLNGAVIYVNSVKVTGPMLRNLPYGDAEGSLKSNANISVRTIDLVNASDATIDDAEGKSFLVSVTRNGSAFTDGTDCPEQAFTLIPSQTDKIDIPASFSIPRGAESATLTIDFVEATTEPMTLRLRPSGYTTDDGDVVITINITAGTKPAIYVSGPSQLEEGVGIAELTVTLARPPKEQTTVNVTEVKTGTTNPSGAIEFLSSTQLVWGPGDASAKTVTIRPLDGDANVTVTATPTSTAYEEGKCPLFVANVNPALTSPPAEGWEPAKGGEGFAYTVSWSGKDVLADHPGLDAVIHWGDGTTSTIDDTPQGSTTHTYNVPGTFGITVELHDKDGGVATAAGAVEIEAAVQVLINEHKVKLPVDVGQNGYKGLQGLGRGTIDDRLDETDRTQITAQIDWQIKYSPATATATLIATPEPVTLEGVDYDGNRGDYEYDSFFHVWMGDDDTFRSKWCLVPMTAPASAAIRLRDGDTAEDRQVGGVFSREHYAEDNYADIDWDRLPDAWENLYLTALLGNAQDTAGEGTYPFETAAGDLGETGNSDNDFFPACVDRVLADGSFAFVPGAEPRNNYAAYGIPFINLYEVRGTHPALNAKDSDKIEELIDEPHKGDYDDDGNFTDTDDRDFYGTDPTKADTDGDRLTDGYEYFFWRQASFADEPIGEAYDPALVTEGTPIDNAIIVSHFNPCVANNHVELDTDGDGLSNFEEFLLGTNPTRWDTDGDTMNDGWEVMWGLNPFANDAGGNTDGDYMAWDGGENFHYDVYNVYGFDPRTGWAASYVERNRELVLPSPNTFAFRNVDEHGLARWLIDHGVIAACDPMSTDFMTQPVPAGHRRHLVFENGTHHVPYEASDAQSVGYGYANGTFESYSIPFGSQYYLVQSVEITSDGSDTDGDGMPDGWELYVGAPAGVDFETGELLPPESASPDFTIWPIQYPSIPPHAPSDNDFDGLPNQNECHSTELCAYYSGIYTNGAFASANGNWYNKWWPTDPWNSDTDGDHVSDAQEGDATFMYQTDDYEACVEKFAATTMRRGHIPGAGLNPCAIDTDMDYIPDHWEYLYAGDNRDAAWEGGFVNRPGEHSYLSNGAIVLAGGGMDGTYFDSRAGYDEHSQEERAFDYDGDGLDNYQEYMVNAVQHFQYDKWAWFYYVANGGTGTYGDYDANLFFLKHVDYSLDAGTAYPFYDSTTPTIPNSYPTDVPGFQKPGFATARELPFYYEPRVQAWLNVHPTFQTWDWSAYVDDWQNADPPQEIPTVIPFTTIPQYPFSYMPSEIRPLPFGEYLYASTDPRLADSDGDNMDDYYEMFHGLNPILSDSTDYCNQGDVYYTVSGKVSPVPVDPMSYDFHEYPWLVGMPNADPDQDGIANWEEALSPNQPAPANHNTDPSPLWMTDSSDLGSFVNLYYNLGHLPNYWTAEGMEQYEFFPDPEIMSDVVNPLTREVIVENRPAFIFSFEQNEGFDTDNDNLSDRYEVNGVAGGVTDPQNCDRPTGRKALYLDGNSAARTRAIYAFGLNTLRSWTIEVWVNPEDPASGKDQVILERPVVWDEADTTETYEMVRRTFRLGLRADGRPFVEFNSGGKDYVTEQSEAPEGDALKAGRWYHLAGTMDGFQKKLALYIDGRRVASKSTSAIPYTGFTYSDSNGIGTEYLAPRWAPIVVGASDANPNGYVEGTKGFDFPIRYHNTIGWIPVAPEGQPALSDFFKGWIDEIRIWSGARPGGEDPTDLRVAKWRWPTIQDDYNALKRYGSAEVREARDDTVKYMERVLNERKYRLDQKIAAESFPVSTNAPDTDFMIDADGLTFEEFYARAILYLQMTGGEDNLIRVAPHLIGVYNFDSLPDPDYESVLPAKFNRLNGRPENYEGVQWLLNADDKTTVYTSTEAPYAFPQYAQNLVAALPLGHLATKGEDTEYTEMTDGERVIALFKYREDHVADSKFWTRDASGGIPVAELASLSAIVSNNIDGVENTFPNNANPYGVRYETANHASMQSHPQGARPDTFDPVSAMLYNDLLPLRAARADMSVQLWDDPLGTEKGVNLDSDGDGIPDYWEVAHGMDPHNADQNGNGVQDGQDDFDGDGLTNWYEFLADTDPFDRTTDGVSVDANVDSDNDGLTNGQEQQYGTHPLFADTDDDGWLDGYEVNFGSNPLDAADPFRPHAVRFQGEVNRLVSKPLARYTVNGSFTLSAMVRPTAFLGNDAMIVSHANPDDSLNYFIRMDQDGIVTAGFDSSDGSGEATISAPAFRTLPLNDWTKIDFRFDREGHAMELLFNDVQVAYLPTMAVPASDDNVNRRPVIMGENFNGYMRSITLTKGENLVMDFRCDDGTSFNADMGVFTAKAVNEYVADQVEDFAPINGKYAYGSVAYRVFEYAAATFEGDIVSVTLDESLEPVSPADAELIDTDGDGLPDEWEIANGLNPYNADTDGDGVTDDLEDPDLDGLTNAFEYLAGTDPNNAKTDGATFDGDADGDGDGLSNILEQLYGTDPDATDTDDDGIADGDEVFGTPFTLPTSALSPARQGVMNATGTAATIFETSVLAALHLEKSWTVEAWVKGATDGIIVRKGSSADAVNYELGLEGGKPYARIAGVYPSAPDSALVVKAIAESAISADDWTHVAAVWNDDTRVLALYVDGVLAANVYRREIDLGVFAQDGGAPLAIGEGLSGKLDEVRIWDIARSGASIGAAAYRTFEHAQTQPLVEFRFDDFGLTAENFGSVGGQLVHAEMVEDETSPIAADEFVDSDGDKIPDFWEITIFGSVMACDPAGDEDEDGLSNLTEYYAFTYPLTKYTGDAAYGTGSNASLASDAAKDTDDDGLTNLQEQNLGTRPDLADTDDDGWTDYEEVNGVKRDGTKVGVSDPLNALSPAIPRAAKFDGTGSITVPQRGGQSLASWTVAAWIRPDAGNASAPVVARAYQGGNVNFEIGVETSAAGDLVPYARYTGYGVDDALADVAVSLAETATTVRDDNPAWLTLKTGEWRHIAATYTSTNSMNTVTNGLFTLYLDGTAVAWRQDALPAPFVGAGAGTPLNGKLVIGEGFKGLVDDVRVVTHAVSADDIVSIMGGGPIAAPQAKASRVMSAEVASKKSNAIAGDYIVRFRDGITKTASAATVTALGGNVRQTYNIINAAHVTVPQGADENAFVAGLKADPSVLYVEPNLKRQVFKAPNDTDYSKLWGLHNEGQTGGTAGCDIKAEDAWEYLTGSREVVVAVIDTGVDYKHPDLANNMWQNPGEIPDNGVDDDGNGLIDDVYGWNFYEGNADPADTYGHGTHCAGTIGGVGNNGQGVAGVNWNVKIMALRVGDQFGLPSSAIIAAIDYSVQMGARLSSNSYGGYGFSQAEYEAVKAAGEAGMLFVAAAGNEANDNDAMPAYPASFDLDCVVAVAATDHKDGIADFSNYGATAVDLGAPGVDIWSAAPTALVPSGYQNMSGTSMACPHVAGAAALVFAADPTLTASAVKGLLLEYADPVDSLAGKCVSGGRLNVGAIIPVIFNPGGDLPVPASARGLGAHLRFDDGGASVHDFARGQDAFRVDAYAGCLEGGVTLVTDAEEDLDLVHFFADSDGDSLPDWWEEMVGFSPLSALSGGRNGDDDGDGLSNFYEYRASLALFAQGLRGLDPLNPDTDNDGIADYDEDSDADGLTNGEEQDTYLSDPGAADADDDNVADGDELAVGLDPTDAAAPYVSRALTFSGASGDANTVIVKDKVDGVFTERFSSEEWTVEAWVNPAAASLSGEYPLVSRALFATGALNYEIGITDGKPYARYTAHDASTVAEVVAGGAIADSAWTHIAARLDANQDSVSSCTLTLFVNGEPVAMKDVGIIPATGPGDLVFGSSGFKGQMFDVRVWKIPQTDASIKGMMQSELLGGKIKGMSGILTVNGNGFLKEAATTLKANGDPIDLIEDSWTVEAWIKTTGNSGLVIARRNHSETTADDFNYAIQMNPDGSLRGRFAIWFLYVVSRERDKDGNETVTYATMFDFTVNDLVGEMRVNDGQWHHVAYVRTATQCKLYVDGLLDASQGALLLPAGYEIVDYGIRAAPGPVVIGEGFTGSLEETRIWNRDLSTAEIGLYSHQNLAGSENGLIQYFTYDFETDDRYVTEHATVRDNVNEKGVFIRTLLEEAFVDTETSGPENFRNSPIRSLQNLSLSGAFTCRDGGVTVEDRTSPMAYGDFHGVKYAGVFGSGVAFADQNPLSWTETIDSDGDGLTDIWEVTYGLDPYNSDQDGNGLPDGYDDFDRDGLRNEAEYRAGLDPWNQDTDGDGALDYDDAPDSLTANPLSYGWLYTDGDYVLDAYEAGWDDVYASPFRYDEHEDRDLDGWDNWSEGLVGTALAYNTYNVPSTNGMAVAESSVADKAANFPLPDLAVTLDYHGETITGAKLVIHAYSRADMNGWPDAVFVKDFSGDTLDTWPMTVAIGKNELAYGHLRQGRNWFYAWMDEDGSSLSSVPLTTGGNWLTWTAPEPAAIADNQLDGIDVGFGLNEITFHLTDKAESFGRYSWAGQMPEGEDVNVVILDRSGGNAIFDRTIKWPRTWLHEGDIISWNIERSGNKRNFGLCALGDSVSASDDAMCGFPIVLTPQHEFEADQWRAEPNDAPVISNWMHTASALAKPALYGPVGYEIVADARPEFKFSLDPEFTEFQFTLKRINLSSGENVAIFNQRVLAPGRFRNDVTGRRDLVIWHFPHSVGDRIVNGGSSYLFADGQGFEYRWTVVPYSPAIRTAQVALTSSEGVFLTAAKNAVAGAVNVSGGKGAITVTVTYPSGMVALDPATTYVNAPFIRVQAFRSKSFNGLPDASIQAKAVGTYTLTGLEDGQSYYIRAYIEQGGDAYARDKWESWGYYREGAKSVSPFMPVAVKANVLGNADTKVNVVIQDCDTDNDLLPDSYEWATAGNLTSLGVANYAPTVKQTAAYAMSPLRLMASAPGVSDADADGVNDYQELLDGTNLVNGDSDGDGIVDGLEKELGFDASTQQTLKITSVNFDASGNPVIGWTWDGVQTSSVSQPGVANLASASAKPATLSSQVAYEVQAKVSLTDAEWTTIRTVRTNLVDGEAVVSEEGAPAGVDVSAFRFFRVKVGSGK